MARPNGDHFWARLEAVKSEGTEGSPVFRVVISDIAERKQMEEALRESEGRLRLFIEHAPVALAMFDKKMRYLAASRRWNAHYGLGDRDLHGLSHYDVIPEIPDSWEQAYCRGLAGEVLLRGEDDRFECAGGNVRRNQWEIRPWHNKNGEVEGILVFSDELTRRKQAEVERERLAQSIAQVSESVVITDLNGAILYVNPAFEKLSGFSRNEAVGNNTGILKSGHHPASFYQQMWATLLRGETWSGELVNKCKDGKLYNTSATISPIKDQDGNVVNFVGVGRDETDELMLREQLNRSRKMESVGRLAGGIAHDFNNLLMIIRTYTELLQTHLPLEDSSRRYTEQVLSAVERGANLTSQMLAFSRKRAVSPVALDLNVVIDEATKMLKRVIGEDIEFRVVLTESLWTTEADPDQIFQVLMNFCVNSRDAMPRGGILTIATENVIVEQLGMAGRPYVLPGEYVKLSVADTGVGVGKEIQDEIFEPFFTTKEVGKGTGLGLATVYGIVKQSNGYVWVDSEVGEGACFTVYLPKIRWAVEPPALAKSKALPIGTETLLVVEDEDFLRQGICEFLRSLGYKVLVANSGPKALLLASEHPHIDLLLTNVVMPKMSGAELSHMLGSLRPGLKMIFMSGYTDDELLRSGVQESHTALLQKPFGLGTLAQKVRDTLDSVQ